MEKNQLIFFILFASMLLILLVGFLLFMLFWQRNKSNKYIKERETMQLLFNEQLLKAQLEIQEESFNNISMEIHDNVGQTLSLLKVQLNIIEQKASIDNILITEAKQNVGKAMTDLRDIARSLNTDRIKLSTLNEMTEHELERIAISGFIEVSFNSEGKEILFDSEKKLIIFRIIQECLQNIIKHSEASRLAISFNYGIDGLKVLIIDNGKGFETEQFLISNNKGLGIKNIINRARIIGGQAEISSNVNQGTKITIITPYG